MLSHALYGHEEIKILNRMLFERLGSVCGGSQGRFAWHYAPDMLWATYDRDDRTLLKKTWADMASPIGGVLGRVWLLAQWKKSIVYDHHGYGEGARIPFIQEWGYQPHLETALMEGQMPTGALTANYCWALDQQLAMSAEYREDSYENYVGEEAWSTRQRQEKEKIANRERAMHVYDDNVGAFGNCEVGVGDGFMSFGGTGDSPLIQKLNESSAA